MKKNIKSYDDESLTSIRENLQSLRDDGIEEYEILATLDLDTCPKCGEMDEKIFKVCEAKVSINCPPFHSGCRCCIAPFVRGIDSQCETRIARDPITNKNIQIEDMPYIKWYEKYVKPKLK